MKYFIDKTKSKFPITSKLESKFLLLLWLYKFYYLSENNTQKPWFTGIETFMNFWYKVI